MQTYEPGAMRKKYCRVQREGYKTPTFWTGFFSAFDIFGQQPTNIGKRVYTPISDEEAIKRDWIAIGEDLRTAMKIFEDEYVNKPQKKQ